MILPAGFPASFNTVEEVTKFVTMVIFTVSAQHAAVNNGQVTSNLIIHQTLHMNGTSSRLVGNVGCRFWKENTWNIKMALCGSAVAYWFWSFVSKLSIMLPFQKLVPTFPTMQLSHWVTSLEAVYQITWSFLGSHKRLYATLFTYSVLLP